MSGLPPARRGKPLGEHVYSGPKHFTVAQERLGSAQPRPSIEPPRTLARSHLGDETLMRVVCTTCCYRGLNRDELTETLDGAPRSPGLLEHPSGGGQGCRHLARLQHGCQFDEEGAPGSFLGQLCGHLHGQAGLTRPPGPGHRHQAPGPHQRADLGLLGSPADKAAGVRGEAARQLDHMSRVRGGQASQFLAHRLAGLLQRHRRLEPEFSQPVATAAVGSGDLVALALGAVGTWVVPGLVGLDRKTVRS